MYSSSQHFAYLDSHVVMFTALVFAELRLSFLDGHVLQEVSIALCLRTCKPKPIEERHHLKKKINMVRRQQIHAQVHNNDSSCKPDIVRLPPVSRAISLVQHPVESLSQKHVLCLHVQTEMCSAGMARETGVTSACACRTHTFMVCMQCGDGCCATGSPPTTFS